MTWTRQTRRAFVSSTYRDLRASRRLIGDQLVAAGILPVGMEIFPAAGTGPWEVIRSAIESSDFYVLIVGGCYGSLAPIELAMDANISWTRLEYEYARKCGKPIVTLMHGDPNTLTRDHVDDRDSPIWDFRSKLQGEVLVRHFHDDADLIAGLHTSLLHLMERQDWNDLKAATNAPVSLDLDAFLRRVYDRRYDFLSANWSYEISPAHPERWDATCRVGRALRPNWAEGLAVWAYTLNKPAGEYESFYEADPPALLMSEWERSESGDVAIRDRPRRLTRSSYAHDVDFRPPLRRNEFCSFRFQVEFPRYRFAYRDDVIAASTHAAAGVRDYELNSLEITYPTDRMILSVTLPRSLDAEILGFRVRKNSISADEEETARLDQLGCYSIASQGECGKELTVATLDVPNPVLRRVYEIRWKPPRRPTM